MKATEAKAGKLYRVTKVPAWEYLTQGEVYECTGEGQKCVSFHRPKGGAGTFLMGAGLAAVEVEAV